MGKSYLKHQLLNGKAVDLSPPGTSTGGASGGASGATCSGDHIGKKGFPCKINMVQPENHPFFEKENHLSKPSCYKDSDYNPSKIKTEIGTYFSKPSCLGSIR